MRNLTESENSIIRAEVAKSGGTDHNLVKIRALIGEMLLLFSWNYIIIFLVKRIYPSKIFFT
mgnify:FL=1